MRKLSRIVRYLGDYKAKISLYFLSNLLAILFGLFSFSMLAPVLQVLFRENSNPSLSGKTDLLSRVSDQVQRLIISQGKLQTLGYICIAVVVFTMLKNLCIYLAQYILNPIRNAVLRRMRDDIFTKTLSLPIGFFTEERKGDLLSRMTNDINEVELSIMATLEVIFREPFAILITLSYMIFISPTLTLFLLVFLPVSGLIIGRIGKSLKKSSNIAQEQLANMLGVIDETLVGMRVVKAFGAEKHQHIRFMQINNYLFRTRNKIAARRELASPFSETLGVLIVSVVLWYGGQLIFSNQSPLTAEKFLLYIVLFTQIINPFKNLSTSFFNIQKGAAAIERIEHLLDAEATIKDLPNAKPIKGFEHSIEFKNVSFAYGDRQILQDVNLTIEKGKTIALVGASGAGKSTLVDLIPRFHDVSSGELLIDGENVKNYRLFDLRRLMGVVSQDPILFNDTIYNNITLGSGGAHLEQVKEAAQIAHAEKFIEAKPEGYETVAGDRGTKLSGGERQRITIARAVLKNPPILILDEATSSLDTESERMVQEAINSLMKNRTCLVIAHRLSTVRHADEIIVLEKGQIIERGTHLDLINKNGAYKRLVEMQQVR
ncbi:MAG: ABC transporter ATP-binding protein [Bacteroidetes bacterium]|nr:ABC transporter ATP-binding protein [Bacteroidota bacterium]MBS1739652.1 ABC transporter ATP-binding protein [Bacteroidota bacterium]